MVVSYEFRMGQYRDDYHREDAPHFNRNLLKHRKVKAEQEQNKKLQNQIREMEKKIQDLGEEHKKEISKIKKVCLYGDSNQRSFALMCILGTFVRNIKIKFGMGNKDEITGR